MKRGVFVTGTDTGIGKTLVACALLHAYRRAGLSAVGMKPVAAGCDAEGRNEDVEALRAASGVDVTMKLTCPYLLKDAVAPHIAAQREDRRIALQTTLDCFRELAGQAEAVVIEGVGGFLVPLNERENAGDLAVALGLPVVLVVGLRLGCLNHALLTQEAVESRGLRMAGWVANRIDPHMARAEENIDALRLRLRAPLLADIPFQTSPNAEAAGRLFDMDVLRAG
ncbi:MAG TPA: dethiobiotin synthase [Burkholderiales bacterium]|nr:dethiobiotin synthase [Burkholderiales bacterium]